MYGQYIKDVIEVNGTNKQVKFFDRTGAKSYAQMEIRHTMVYVKSVTRRQTTSGITEERLTRIMQMLVEQTEQIASPVTVTLTV